MENYTIHDNGNINNNYDNDYMGRIVQKNDCWSAYLRTAVGDAWLADYGDSQDAAEAVYKAYLQAIAQFIEEAFA